MPTSGEYMPLPVNIRYIVRIGALIRPRNGVQNVLAKNLSAIYHSYKDLETVSECLRTTLKRLKI